MAECFYIFLYLRPETQIFNTMKRIITALMALTICSSFAFAQGTYVPSNENLDARERFSDRRFGIFVHWGVYSMLGNGEWVMNNKGIPYSEYSHYPAGFCPSRFDAEQWISTFKAAGAKYLTITSRHHDGFSMFKSEASDYNVVDATPFKRDVLKELADACSKEDDFALGFYYSHLDWGRDDYYPLGRTGQKSGRPQGDAGSWQHYIDFMCAQLTELLTNYGDVACIWFDGIWDKDGGSPEKDEEIWQLRKQYDLIHSLQPGCLVGNNHHKPVFEGEDIQIFEKDVPGENKAGFSAGSVVSDRLPLETCQTIYNSWGYDVTDYNYKSIDQLITLLVKTSGKGANLLLNIGPRPDGTLPEESVDRLLGIGKWLEKYGEAIYGTDGGCVKEQPWGVTTQSGKTLFVHVLNRSDVIFVPFKGNKLLTATTFDGSQKVPFRQVEEGILLTLPQPSCDGPDQIIRLGFKSELF